MRSPCPLLATLFLLPLALVPCACTVFTDYPSQMQASLADFEEGRLSASYTAVKTGMEKGTDRLLYLLEGGMILHCTGSTAESNDIFTQAYEVIRAYREKAVLSLGQGTAQVGSVLVNEKTLPYQGELFERVLVDTFKATNYLFMRDYEGARVEIRRSFASQQENRRLNQTELERMEREAGRGGIRANVLFPNVESHYHDQADVLSRAGNPYEDPFAYYLSAVVYELNREYNDALIDLKRVEALRPGIPFVQNDLLRMARLSGISDGLPRSIPRHVKPRFIRTESEGELLFILECGMAPRKGQIRVDLPIPDVGIVPLAFPKYECIPSRIHGAVVCDRSGQRLAETYMLTDVEALLVRNLMDRMPILLLKQAIRASAKGAMAKTATDQGGVVGALLSTTYNLVTEQADLRSWLTLPRNIQAARMPLPAGDHELRLAFLDAAGRPLEERTVPLEIRAGQLSVLNARTGSAGVIAVHAY